MLIASAYDEGDTGRSRIKHFLRLSKWSIDQAALLITNLDPDLIQFSPEKTSFVKVTTLFGNRIPSQDQGNDADASLQASAAGVPMDAVIVLDEVYLEEKYEQVDTLEQLFLEYIECRGLLDDLSQNRTYATPAEWVQLAQAAEIHVPWREAAIRKHWFVENASDSISDTSISPSISHGRWSHIDYLLAIGALLELMLGKAGAEVKPPALFSNQKGLIAEIERHYARESFLSSSNLEKIFAKANKVLGGKYLPEKSVANKSHSNYLIVIGALSDIAIRGTESRNDTSTVDALTNAIQQYFPSLPFSKPANFPKLFTDALQRLNEH